MGGTRCIIAGCGNSSKSRQFSFHRLPKDEKLRRAWKRFVKLTRPNVKFVESSTICSSHFKEDCFDTVTHRFQEEFGMKVSVKARLKRNSIPSIYPKSKTNTIITENPYSEFKKNKRNVSSVIRKREIARILNDSDSSTSSSNDTDLEAEDTDDSYKEDDSKMDEYGSEASDSSSYTKDTGEQDPDSVPAQSNKPGQSEPKSGHSTTSNTTTEKETAEDTEQEDDFMDDIYEVDVKTPIFNNLAALLSSQAGSSKKDEDKVSVTSPTFTSLISKILSPVGTSNKTDTQLSNHSNTLILHPETVNCKDSGDASRPNKVQQQVYIKVLQEAVIIYPLKIFNPQHSNPNEVHTQTNKTCATSVL